MIRVVIDVAAPEGLKARAFLRKRRIPLTRRAFRENRFSRRPFPLSEGDRG